MKIVYDGDCPFCSAYVKMIRLRESAGPVCLVDARNGGPLVARVRAAGYDLNEGMALVIDDQIYHGSDCVNRIALMTTPSGVFNALNVMIFRSARLSRLIYPVLRAGRNATLLLLGRRRLSEF